MLEILGGNYGLIIWAASGIWAKLGDLWGEFKN